MSLRCGHLTLSAQPGDFFFAGQFLQAVDHQSPGRRSILKRSFSPGEQPAARLADKPAHDSELVEPLVELRPAGVNVEDHRVGAAPAFTAIDQHYRADPRCRRNVGFDGFRLARLHGHQSRGSALGVELLDEHFGEGGDVFARGLVALGLSTPGVDPAMLELVAEDPATILTRHVTRDPDDPARVVDVSISGFTFHDDWLSRYPYREGVARGKVELHGVTLTSAEQSSTKIGDRDIVW